MMGDESWGAGQWLVMSLMMIVVVAAVVALTTWLVRDLAGPRESGTVRVSEPGSRLSPKEILADRFARGEIDEDELARSVAVLGDLHRH